MVETNQRFFKKYPYLKGKFDLKLPLKRFFTSKPQLKQWIASNSLNFCENELFRFYFPAKFNRKTYMSEYMKNKLNAKYVIKNKYKHSVLYYICNSPIFKGQDLEYLYEYFYNLKPKDYPLELKERTAWIKARPELLPFYTKINIMFGDVYGYFRKPTIKRKRSGK